MKNKKIKVLVLVVFIIAIVLSINAIISNIITKKINQLVINNSFKLHTAKVDNVKFNLFQRSVTANKLFLTPTKESIYKLKGQSLKNKELEKVSISSIEFKGIHIFKILFDNDIEINEIIVNNLLFLDFINPKIKTKPNDNGLNLDSIYIQKIKGLQINKIKFNNFNYQQIDINSKQMVFHHDPFNFKIDGFVLKKVADQVFKLMPIKNVFEIKDVQIKLPKKGYDFQIGLIKLDFKNTIITIEKLKLKPLINKNALANTYNFSKAVFDAEIDKMFIYNFQIKKVIKKQGIYIDSIEMTDFNLNVFKDKNKPFDESKRPKDPHVLLKEMKSPLHVQKLIFTNGNISFEAKLKKNDLSMKVDLANINANVKNLTSIKKFRENPLEINFRADLMNRSKMHLNIVFPLVDSNNSFMFNGTLGPAKLKYFDSAIYPTLGLKVLTGELDGMKFDAVAHPYNSEGTMTMLYHNLKAEVFKSQSLDENKFLSWVVNEATYKSNPKKNKPAVEVVLQADRTFYKGFINYIWKTLESGIIATITPFGTTSKKAKKKKLKKEKREKGKTRN